jgi:hypothetical protein
MLCVNDTGTRVKAARTNTWFAKHSVTVGGVKG